MKFFLTLLALLAAGWGGADAAPGLTSAVSANRILVVDPSSMPVIGGKVTLTIGPLQRADGVYSGVYKISVFPYFFERETGRLAIIVSDESMARLNQGMAVAAIIGTATTSGRGGMCRHIDATAMPADMNRGTIKLWFMAGDRKMTFEPAYHFSGERTAAVRAGTTEFSPGIITVMAGGLR